MEDGDVSEINGGVTAEGNVLATENVTRGRVVTSGDGACSASTRNGDTTVVGGTSVPTEASGGCEDVTVLGVDMPVVASLFRAWDRVAICLRDSSESLESSYVNGDGGGGGVRQFPMRLVVIAVIASRTSSNFIIARLILS